MWAISSAISVAFFALSGIAAQLLNALGLDGEWQSTGSVPWSLACHLLFVGAYLFRAQTFPQVLNPCQVSPEANIRAG